MKYNKNIIIGMFGILAITLILVLVFIFTAFASNRTVYVIPAPNDTLEPIETTSPTPSESPTGVVTTNPAPTASVQTVITGRIGVGIPTMSRSVRTIKRTPTPSKTM